MSTRRTTHWGHVYRCQMGANRHRLGMSSAIGRLLLLTPPRRRARRYRLLLLTYSLDDELDGADYSFWAHLDRRARRYRLLLLTYSLDDEVSDGSRHIPDECRHTCLHICLHTGLYPGGTEAGCVDTAYNHWGHVCQCQTAANQLCSESNRGTAHCVQLSAVGMCHSHVQRLVSRQWV